MTKAPYPRLEYVDETHTYTYHWTESRREVLSSVTQILEDVGLTEDFNAIPNIDMDWYGDRGTKIHLATHLYDINDLVEESVDPRIKGYLDAYKLAKKEIGFSVLRSEVKVCDPLRKFAGTFDKETVFLGDHGFIPGDLAIFDIKSGQPHPSHGLQLAGYAQGNRTPTHQRFGLYLKSNGKYRLKQYTDMSDFNIFNSALNVHLKRREIHGHR